MHGGQPVTLSGGNAWLLDFLSGCAGPPGVTASRWGWGCGDGERPRFGVAGRRLLLPPYPHYPIQSTTSAQAQSGAAARAYTGNNQMLPDAATELGDIRQRMDLLQSS